MSNSKLIPISYDNKSQGIRLSAYADTIVYEPKGNVKTLRAIRFGGYPEMVNAMSDAIYAGGRIEATIGDRCCLFAGESKRFERQLNHDGVYAEATLLAKDDDMDAEESGDEDENPDQESFMQKPKERQAQENRPPRKCIIFCPKDDKDRLFEELDSKTAVPLIPEFRDYVLEELQRRDILQRLAVISIREKIDAWTLICEKDDANIISVVEDGLRSGAIAIPCEVKDPNGFDAVENVTGYLNTFGVTVAERIRSQFKPLFDPASEPLSPEILAINDYIREHAGYPLYDAQLAVAESVKRQLTKDKVAFIVAECGSGKTKIGSTAMAAVYGLHANQAQRSAKKTFNVILCPSHVAKKWVREIAETLPNAAGIIVRSITELDKVYALYEKGDKSIYVVISKEKARDGFMKRPAILWNKRRKAYLCPECMSPIEVPVSAGDWSYTERATQMFFRKENKKNHKCPNCGGVLWTAVNPSEKSDWVKIGGYGWVYRYRVREHYQFTKNEGVLAKLREIAQNPDGLFPAVGASRRYPLSTYFKHRYKGRLDGLICDELHEYNNDSGQGDAMGELYNTAKKVIGMTATLPTISFFAASNEIPNFNDPQEKILAALYDRLELKVVTADISDRAKRLAVLHNKQANLTGIVNSDFTLDELRGMQAETAAITVSDAINELMDDILCELRKSVTVSDRKYLNFYPIVQAKAWLNGHSEVQSDDLLARMRNMASHTPRWKN